MNCFDPEGAGYDYGDYWYDNPLGISPLSLHTRNGFLLPAVAVGLCLLLTDKDTLADRVALYSEGGVSWGYKYPRTTLSQCNFGIEYKLRDWVSIGADLDFYLPVDDYNNTFGAGIRPFARFYFINSGDLKVYFESGGGIIYFSENFPKPTKQDNRLGTYWNGTTKYGIGGQYKIGENTFVQLGIRHIHVSNGNTKGVERNPSHDSNGFFIGISYIP